MRHGSETFAFIASVASKRNSCDSRQSNQCAPMSVPNTELLRKLENFDVLDLTGVTAHKHLTHKFHWFVVYVPGRERRPERASSP